MNNSGLGIFFTEREREARDSSSDQTVMINNALNVDYVYLGTSRSHSCFNFIILYCILLSINHFKHLVLKR